MFVISFEAFLGAAISLAILGSHSFHCLHILEGYAALTHSLCPTGRVYFNATRKCYPLSPHRRGPCPEMMRLERSSENREMGECNCEQPRDGFRHCPTRPLLLVKDLGRCYPLFHQGPCRNGEWLVAGKGNAGVCEKIPCPEKYYSQSSSRPGQLPYRDIQFVFAFSGQCFTTGDRCSLTYGGVGAYFNGESFNPACISSRVCGGHHNVHGYEDDGCGHGHAADADGGCEPLLRI